MTTRTICTETTCRTFFPAHLTRMAATARQVAQGAAVRRGLATERHTVAVRATAGHMVAQAAAIPVEVARAVAPAAEGRKAVARLGWRTTVHFLPWRSS